VDNLQLAVEAAAWRSASESRCGYRAIDLARLAASRLSRSATMRTLASCRRCHAHPPAIADSMTHTAGRSLPTGLWQRAAGPHTAGAGHACRSCWDVPRAARACRRQPRRYARAAAPAGGPTQDALEAIARQAPDTTELPAELCASAKSPRASVCAPQPCAVGVGRPAETGPRGGTDYRRFSPADVRDAQMILMLRQASIHCQHPAGTRRPAPQAGSTDALHAAVRRAPTPG